MKRGIGLAPSLTLIAVLAVALAAIRVATTASARVSSALFLIAVLTGTLGLIVRRDRGLWLGFALFGWTYLLVAIVSPLQAALSHRLPNDDMIDWLIVDKIHPLTPKSVSPFPFEVYRQGNTFYKLNGNMLGPILQPTPPEVDAFDAYMNLTSKSQDRRLLARQTCYAFAGLAFALLGAIAGRILSDRATPPAGSPEVHPSHQSG